MLHNEPRRILHASRFRSNSPWCSCSCGYGCDPGRYRPCNLRRRTWSRPHRIAICHPGLGPAREKGIEGAICLDNIFVGRFIKLSRHLSAHATWGYSGGFEGRGYRRLANRISSCLKSNRGTRREREGGGEREGSKLNGASSYH